VPGVGHGLSQREVVDGKDEVAAPGFVRSDAAMDVSITAYAERLLDELDELIGQRIKYSSEWIGRTKCRDRFQDR